MGTEAAPRLPGSTSCILMFMQFLQLCPWKWHSGCCVSPRRDQRTPQMSETAATFLCAPMQKGIVQRAACAQHSLEPFLLGSSRSGARAGGGTEQGWGVEEC